MVLAALAAGAAGAGEREAVPGGGSILVEGVAYSSWAEYFGSEEFLSGGRRCGTEDREPREFPDEPWREVVSADCSISSTNPSPEYAPSSLFMIPVVVHVIMDDACLEGAISNQRVRSQIDILNEDFLALPGTYGANGSDLQVFFYLATEDPGGAPTTGITRSCNSTWFADDGAYWDTLAWDPNRYLNIYTNSADGFLGYVPFLPMHSNGSFVGRNDDRVVVLWSVFGRDAPAGPPFNQGRTVTHEVGHYLGLLHTFLPVNQCGSAGPPGCYGDGDLICDTEVELAPNSGCPIGTESCGSLDPITNYMDYTDDLCMQEFTLEQTRRIRCSLQHYRPDVYREAIFVDNFELGDTLLWNLAVP